MPCRSEQIKILRSIGHSFPILSILLSLAKFANQTADCFPFPNFMDGYIILKVVIVLLYSVYVGIHISTCLHVYMTEIVVGYLMGLKSLNSFKSYDTLQSQEDKRRKLDEKNRNRIDILLGGFTGPFLSGPKLFLIFLDIRYDHVSLLKLYVCITVSSLWCSTLLWKFTLARDQSFMALALLFMLTSSIFHFSKGPQAASSLPREKKAPKNI